MQVWDKEAVDWYQNQKWYSTQKHSSSLKRLPIRYLQKTSASQKAVVYVLSLCHILYITSFYTKIHIMSKQQYTANRRMTAQDVGKKLLTIMQRAAQNWLISLIILKTTNFMCCIIQVNVNMWRKNKTRKWYHNFDKTLKKLKSYRIQNSKKYIVTLQRIMIVDYRTLGSDR